MQNHSFSHNPRRLLRHLQNAAIMVKWHNLNRMRLWNRTPTTISWEQTFRLINYHNTPLSRSTHPTQSKIKNFKIKIILDEVLTIANLHKRHPDTYKSPTCNWCQDQPESFLHMLTCNKNATSLRTIVKKIATRTTQKYGIQSFDTETLVEGFLKKHITNLTPTPIAIIHNSCKLPKGKITNKEQNDPTIYFYHHVIKSVMSNIWQPKCTTIHQDPCNGEINSNMSRDL